MKKIDQKELAELLGVALLSCLVIGIAIIGSGTVSATIAFQLGSIISGIWAGIAFTFIGRPVMEMDRSWSHGQRQSYLNRLYSMHIILGGAVFCLACVFGSGVVFGMDLIGVCNFGSLPTFLADNIHGNILIITLIGAVFGMFMGVPVWFDTNLKNPTTLGKIVLLWIGIPFIFFSFAFSDALATPFIFAACVSRLLSSAVLHKFLYPRNASQFQKSLMVTGLFLVPLVAYISRLMMICPK